MISFRQADLLNSLDQAAHPVVGLVFARRIPGPAGGGPNRGPGGGTYTTSNFKNVGLKIRPEDASIVKGVFKDVPDIRVTLYFKSDQSEPFDGATEHTQLSNYVWSKGFDFNTDPVMEFSDDFKEVTFWVKKR